MISTKKGDKGFTDIKNKRISKSDIIIEVIGTIDEAISYLLLADCYCDIPYIEEIINLLSNIASNIAGYNKEIKYQELLDKLEEYINNNENKDFQFVYKYKNVPANYLNVARVNIRKLERTLCKVDNNDYLCIINRLSDFIFVILFKQ